MHLNASKCLHIVTCLSRLMLPMDPTASVRDLWVRPLRGIPVSPTMLRQDGHVLQRLLPPEFDWSFNPESTSRRIWASVWSRKIAKHAIS
jgi:hypothetical protein